MASSPRCIDCKTTILPTCHYPAIPPATLRSNHPPTPPDVAYTRVALQEEEQELQRYDEEIESIRQTLERLERERELLNRKIEERRSWLAPIRRLPAEILERIFLQLRIRLHVGRSTPRNGLRTYRLTSLAITLCHVSVHWRSVATAQRSIWSRIRWVRFDGPMKKDLTPLLDMCLENAGDHPLEISIDWCYEPFAVQDPSRTTEERIGRHDLNFLRTLTNQFSRCEALSLIGLHWEALDHALPDETKFLSLRRLDYHGMPRVNNIFQTSRRFWNAIYNAPCLQGIRTNAITDPMGNPGCVRWSQLKSISVNFSSHYTDFRFLVTHCRWLESLEIYRQVEWEDGPRWDDAIELVALPRLRVLCFYPKSPEILRALLGSLTLPSLKRLNVGFGESDSLDSICEGLRSFSSVLERSSCALSSLRVVIAPWSIDECFLSLFSMVLEGLECLETLEVYVGRMDKNRTGMMNPNNGGIRDIIGRICPLLSLSTNRARAVLPKLVKLYLDDSETPSPDSSQMGLILDVVEERTGPRLDLLGRGDVSALRAAFVEMEFVGKEQSLPGIEERVAVLERNLFICCISWEFQDS
ncbi:hypothetical protein VNI00_001982 [Paramarasmius palmivorus]|uniref:F-box domain-containing protein n=1 Tax=Paramarasmius palmivorus TaxID=297713 RepID=A0AAW0E2K9_9AGAR